MSEMALELIRKAKAEGWKQLNLTFTGINGKIPLEIKDLEDLEVLFLGEFVDFHNSSWHLRRTSGSINNFSEIPDYLPRNLKTLSLNGMNVRDLRPIRSLTQLQQLNISRTRVANIEEIGELDGLLRLDLSSTQVSDLGFIREDSQLRSLDISYTPIRDFRFLTRLRHLEDLDASNTNLVDVSMIGKNTQLKNLTLIGAKIDTLAKIQHLVDLETLYVSGVNLQDISALANFKRLKDLFLSSATISDFGVLSGLLDLNFLRLPRTSINDLLPLSPLINLRSLTLNHTKVFDLSPLQLLESIESIDLSCSNINSLKGLENLEKLFSLDISETNVTDVNPISNLSLLEVLDISKSKVRTLLPIRRLLTNGLRIISKSCNALIDTPTEIAERGTKAILRHWERQEFEGSLPLNEAKVILIGEGAAGKTSLVRRLFKESFSKRQSQTNGILIRKRRYKFGKEEVLVRFWDFGGQEVMHATHKFFLTNRALYLVVLDARKDDKEAEYWLEHVRIYGGDSPVLVVINKIDENPSFAVNEKGLREKFGERIQGFYKISCNTKQGVADLEKVILDLIDRSQNTHTPMPRASRLIKDAVEGLSENFVSYDRYRELCAEHGLQDFEEQMNLLSVLNDLGIALNFEQLKSFNTSVLNPEWLTQAVYRIINAYKAQEQGGEFFAHQVGELLNDRKYSKDTLDAKRYPSEKFEFIAEAMSEFELCYRFPSGKRKSYLMPGLLPPEEKDGQFDKDGCARLIFIYPTFLPPSIFPRFIVQMNPWIVKEYSWRTGAVLENTRLKAKGLVKLDRQDKKLEIWTSGKGSRQLMEFIRDTIKELNNEFDELHVQELVPLEAGRTVSYQELVGHEEANRPEFFSGELRKSFNVKELLNGIETDLRRQSQNWEPTRVFISYSHDYPHHKQKLVTHLAPFSKSGKVAIWEDGLILPGQEWAEEIWRAHDEAELVICLLSPEFIASKYCLDLEFGQALMAEQKGEKIVVLIAVEYCGWQSVPSISQKQVIPNRPIAAYKDSNRGWDLAMKQLQPLIEKMQTGKDFRWRLDQVAKLKFD